MEETPPSAQPVARLSGLDLSCGRLFDQVPCYISIQDREYTVLEANATMIADFGDPVGRKCYVVYKGRRERCPECPVGRTFEDGREHTSEEVLFDLRGLPHDAIVHTRPLRDRGGELVAAMEMFTDITVQKELEHRLHDSLTRYHTLFDVAPCYITVQDRELRILDANSRFEESFGSPRGGYCYRVYKHRDERCQVCPVAETFADGLSHQSEEVVTDNQGRKVHVVVQTAPVRDSRGNVTAVMEMSTDITRIRALEDKLAALGQLVGSIAHGAKNVLEGLRGGVYVVNAGLRENNQEDIRTGWEMVKRNVDRISALILDMLYCAKDRTPRKLPVALPDVAREVAALFQTRAREREIEIALDLPRDDAIVAGEPKDIHALLTNLVANAVDACSSDPDGEKAHRVIVRVRRDSGHVLLEVADNGAGMDEETQNRLFAGFFSTKGALGTGLGMLVCHKVAAEHGGSIAVRSAPGEGSTFTVRLPAHQPVSATP
jgi:PAS domain S-box-containing protein